MWLFRMFGQSHREQLPWQGIGNIRVHKIKWSRQSFSCSQFNRRSDDLARSWRRWEPLAHQFNGPLIDSRHYENATCARVRWGRTLPLQDMWKYEQCGRGPQDVPPSTNTVRAVKEPFEEADLFWAATQRAAPTGCEVEEVPWKKLCGRRGSVLFTSFLTKAGWPWTCEMCEGRVTKNIVLGSSAVGVSSPRGALKTKYWFSKKIRVFKLLHPKGHCHWFGFKVSHRHLLS